MLSTWESTSATRVRAQSANAMSSARPSGLPRCRAQQRGAPGSGCVQRGDLVAVAVSHDEQQVRLRKQVGAHLTAAGPGDVDAVRDLEQISVGLPADRHQRLGQRRAAHESGAQHEHRGCHPT
jgi:hypothetical protein